VAEQIAIELRPNKTAGYRTFRALVHVAWAIMFRPVVSGKDNIPSSGRVMISPIHRSNVDFAFTVFMTSRKTFFMAKDSLWTVPVLKQLISAMGAFPVKRGTADREAMDNARRVLEMDQALVLFPEGTRQEGYEVAPLHDGAMFLALRTGTPVVPVGIGHSERAMPKGAKIPRPVRVRIVIGRPISPPPMEGRPSRSQISAATESLRSALEEVYHQAMAPF
jgi:1-acyl-sn-glycerol-3-phosphate acyltransferase